MALHPRYTHAPSTHLLPMQHESVQQSRVPPEHVAPGEPQQVFVPLPWLVPQTYFVFFVQHSLLV